MISLISKDFTQDHFFAIQKNTIVPIYYALFPGDFAPGDHRGQGQKLCETLRAPFKCHDSGVLTRQC